MFREHLVLDCMTVTGRAIGENIAGAQVTNPDVICPPSTPAYGEGSLATLRGTWLPTGRSSNRRRWTSGSCFTSVQLLPDDSGGLFNNALALFWLLVAVLVVIVPSHYTRRTPVNCTNPFDTPVRLARYATGC